MGRIYDFISNTTDGVLAVDGRQTIVLWNKAASGLLGHRPEDVLGECCYEVLRGRDAEGCVVCRCECDAISCAKARGLPPRTKIVVPNRRGDQVWLDVSTVVVPSNHRDLMVLIHLFREVTRQHELQRIVRQFADELSGLPPRSDPHLGRHDSGRRTRAGLTRREREVLNQLMTGASTRLIALRLAVSERTARNHVNNLLLKLGVHSRLEAVTFSIRNGLV
jgi:PAS domain S-box-containing protein